MTTILYLSAQLPKRSETFVYRELFGLRAAGIRVLAASLHPPEQDLGEPRLEALAAEVIPVYGSGTAALVRDGLCELFTRPVRALGTMLRAKLDALTARDLSWSGRFKVPAQAFAALALARRLRGRGVTHLHAHFAHAPATVALYTARQLGITFSFTGHAVDLFRDRALLLPKLGRAAFVNCISSWHRAFYQSLVPRPDRAYPVIRCGVDLAEFAPVDHSPGDPPVIFGVGRLVPKKGFDVLVRAAGLLAARGLAFTVVIAGDGPERERLETLRRETGLESRIQLPGAWTNARVREQMACTDLFVLPCQVSGDGDRDGIPVVLMEAMACRVCVVSGDLPTIRELVRDGDTGVMVPPGDPAALADAIAILLSDPERRRVLAEAGRAWVADEFSLEVNVKRMLTSINA
ncbi:MAG TPA: glycosyltransferase family 4 protein [Kiritimatiellia bacterium]|nr:glycosyltransferase family 4 protein [Kiritimatiellia bacterium]HMP34826.1 glycosyltransferase family 4 protein [Kiritimatiellia bacterium]